MSDYMSSGSADPDLSDSEWSNTALNKKKSIRAKNLMKNKEKGGDPKLTVR